MKLIARLLDWVIPGAGFDQQTGRWYRPARPANGYEGVVLARDRVTVTYRGRTAKLDAGDVISERRDADKESA